LLSIYVYFFHSYHWQKTFANTYAGGEKQLVEHLTSFCQFPSQNIFSGAAELLPQGVSAVTGFRLNVYDPNHVKPLSYGDDSTSDIISIACDGKVGVDVHFDAFRPSLKRKKQLNDVYEMKQVQFNFHFSCISAANPAAVPNTVLKWFGTSNIFG
jgi:hypothetical protein